MSRLSHGWTVASGAMLLLLVQPMLGKALLPWFGGSPAVWSACLLFFQALLLLGYALADQIARRLAPRAQLAAVLGLVAAAIATLPIGPTAADRPLTLGHPVLQLLLLLGREAGLPYLVLATASPLSQHWYERTTGRSPYALYALSNAGSLLGLLAYPFVLEPLFDLNRQRFVWSLGFALFALGLVATCAGVAFARARAAQPSRAPAARTSPMQRWRWFALAAVPSVLLLAATNYISLDVAPGPLLWVLPLTLYLLSFVLAFGSERASPRRLFLPLWIAATVALCIALFAQGEASLAQQLGSVLAALFACCMLCHGELARARPPAAQLSRFYFWIAAGGAAGGLFVVGVAPRLFSGFFELQLAAIATYLLLLSIVVEQPERERRRRELQLIWLGLGLGLPLIASTVWVQSRDRTRTGSVVAQRRGFYGVLRVTELPDVVLFSHGRIRHGMQWRSPERRLAPTLYFGTDSGVGRALRLHAQGRARRIGVLGLGAGTLAAYGRPGDVMRFYELSPDVIELARTHFSFLRESRAAIEISAGDGRLALEREPPQHFDLLVLDAFASDSVPAHLLTTEAFAIYLRHLQPDGLLLANVSNRHLDVGRVVAGAARRHRLRLRVLDTPRDVRRGYAHARWALLARDAAILDRVVEPAAALELAGPPVEWTDAFSDLLHVLR